MSNHNRPRQDDRATERTDAKPDTKTSTQGRDAEHDRQISANPDGQAPVEAQENVDAPDHGAFDARRDPAYGPNNPANPNNPNYDGRLPGTSHDGRQDADRRDADIGLPAAKAMVKEEQLVRDPLCAQQGAHRASCDCKGDARRAPIAAQGR